MKGIWNNNEILSVGETGMYKFNTVKKCYRQDIIVKVHKIESGYLEIDENGDNIEIESYTIIPFPQNIG